jgi:serine/threonine protein kinase
LGTPNEDTWPGVTSLPDYKPNFPVWNQKPFEEVFKNLESSGIDLMEQLLTYAPGQRVSAKRAMLRQYFNDLNDDE